MRAIGEKVPEFTIENISDGRFALNRHGITIFVAYSREEIDAWMKIRFPTKVVESLGETMNRAIRRL